MNKGRIWLAGVELSPIGRQLEEEDFEITREDRTASGRLVIDVITVKKRFTLNYSTITGTVLKQLQEVYDAGFDHILQLQIERQDGTIDSYDVKMRPFSRSRIFPAGDWLWEGITIELEEV